MPSLRQSKLIPSGLARPSGALIRIRLFLAVFGGLLLATLPLLAASAQQATDAFITVSYGEPINVRAGPSSFDYPIIGILPKDGTAPAIGRSPKGEWIQMTGNDTAALTLDYLATQHHTKGTVVTTVVTSDLLAEVGIPKPERLVGGFKGV